MKQFLSIADVPNPHSLVELAKNIKQNPYAQETIGKNKTLGLLFFNPSLRTRMSTQKAAMNLGMDIMVMNLNSDSWKLELADGTVMDQGSQEHIKEAVGVVSQYCDIIGIRTFASLTNRTADYEEAVLNKFSTYAQVPVISLESATSHPLQSLADWLTIEENRCKKTPKVVLSWAPHPRALPQAVANSFIEWMKLADVDLAIANPPGFDLAPAFTENVAVYHQQEEALEDADFVYTKNWSSYTEYGATTEKYNNWKIDGQKMALTNQGRFMHCLPVRRNVVVADEVLDSESSLVLEQANNRTFAAQAVLLNLLNHG